MTPAPAIPVHAAGETGGPGFVRAMQESEQIAPKTPLNNGRDEARPSLTPNH